MLVGVTDERVLVRIMVVDEADGYAGLRTDLANGKTRMAFAAEARKRRLDQCLAPILRRLSLELAEFVHCGRIP